MTMYCPRCGSQNNDQSKECGSCSLALSEISAIVANGGKSRFWPRLAVTLLIFVFAPWLALKWGEGRDREFYEFFAGFLLVLLLPGLPWAVSAILNHLPRRR